MSKRKGLIIVFTGEGKGKTTAALGTSLRACGHGMKVLIVQFIKASKDVGEVKVSNRLGPNYKIVPMGHGFIWNKENENKHKKKALEAWEFVKRKINSREYDVIVLDEFTHVLNLEFVSLQEALEILINKPKELHIIITGRKAPKKLIDIADLVTEMKSVKHPYDKGIKAQKGIEF
jgi:cob(I)alamin adenosyltransferase